MMLPNTDPDGLAAAGLRYAIEGPLASITLNRPEVRNAQTPLMWRTLALLGEELPDEVRVVVVSGEGPTFSAGLDRRMLDLGADSGDQAGEGEAESVAGLLSFDDAQISATIDAYQRGFTWLREPRITSIAAVRGYAIGAGFQLALSCDLMMLADDAQLSMKEAALGLVPDLTGTQPLVERVGPQRALELCTTARMIDAREAVDSGVALRVVPETGLDAAVAELVASIVGTAPGVAAEVKALVHGATTRPLEEQRRLEREAQVRRLRALIDGRA